MQTETEKRNKKGKKHSGKAIYGGGTSAPATAGVTAKIAGQSEAQAEEQKHEN
jgi:hypothetical protein